MAQLQGRRKRGKGTGARDPQYSKKLEPVPPQYLQQTSGPTKCLSLQYLDKIQNFFSISSKIEGFRGSSWMTKKQGRDNFQNFGVTAINTTSVPKPLW